MQQFQSVLNKIKHEKHRVHVESSCRFGLDQPYPFLFPRQTTLLACFHQWHWLSAAPRALACFHQWHWLSAAPWALHSLFLQLFSDLTNSYIPNSLFNNNVHRGKQHALGWAIGQQKHSILRSTPFMHRRGKQQFLGRSTIKKGS